MYLERMGYCDITVITDKYDRYAETYCKNLIGCEYATLEQVKEKNMKFDAIIGNPPYKQGLHMKFLEESIKHADVVLFIHPSSVFINLKDDNPRDFNIIKPVLNNIVSLKFVNGNALFDIGLFVPLSITHIDKNHDNGGIIKVTTVDGVEHSFDSISKVNQWGNIASVYSLKSKFSNMQNIMDMNDKNTSLDYKVEFTRVRGNIFKDKNKNIMDMNGVNDDLDYKVEFTRVRGHISKDKNKMLNDDFFTIVSYDKQVIPSKDSANKYELNYYFATEAEATNFLNYLKTNFARRLLSIYKTRQDLHTGEMRLIPWLDFTEAWTDEKLFAHFKLTQEEIDFINDIPDYYGNIKAKREALAAEGLEAEVLDEDVVIVAEDV
jgi:hypothetical protein